MCWRVGQKEEEVDNGICAESINHVSQPNRRILQDDFPEISPACVSNQPLSDEYSRDPDYEDPDVQHPEETLGYDALAEDRADVNPHAESEPYARDANEQPEERPEPIGYGISFGRS